MFDELPEISVDELARRLKSGQKLTILDVREQWELNLAHIRDDRVVALPLSQIARERENAFPPELLDPHTEIVVMCHHGVRSADVTLWMSQQGWKNVFSLTGGIHEYAEMIDQTVGFY